MTFRVSRGRDCSCSWLKRSTSEVTPCRCNTNIVTFGSCSDLGKECRSTVASPQRRSQQRVKNPLRQYRHFKCWKVEYMLLLLDDTLRLRGAAILQTDLTGGLGVKLFS